MIFRSDRKRSFLKIITGYYTGNEGGGIRQSFAR